ncbi:ANR50-like protein [Mya arenaria]|uniref:ANR50-like protein n=1 Tax=Mya arenaria TaxID=6604 RepID=A0ABY7DJL4_MYAAR|nr:ankyrin repeat domain-containing protein 50-like isoform X2 [Mya arenaria]WAQ97891.1 ANR50-like protein [Mya arenaria]
MSHCLLREKRFFCREWAFSKISHCLENRPTAKTSGALIMGGPGSGKTALCCELVWPTNPGGKQVALNNRMLSYHFCQAHNVEALSVSYFIKNMVEQLSCSDMISGYHEIVKSSEIQTLLHKRDYDTNLDDLFKQAVLEPLQQIEPPEKTLFMLVDSIDESYLHTTSEHEEGSKTIAELLANHHSLLPKWLLLMCSSRKQNKTISRMFTGFRKISLDDLRKSYIVRDVQQYILCRLDQEEELRQHLSRETAEMLNQLHIKSNGCFLYLEKVLDGVAEHFIMLREIREIPGTLNGLYLWLCQRLFVRKQFTKVKPVLEVMLAARQPLTDLELFGCAQIKNTVLLKEEFEKHMKILSKILITSPDGTRILFHHSFAEWLLDVKHCTQKYLCNAAEGHGMLALYATLHASKLTPLEVQDFALHLVKSTVQCSIEHNQLVQWLLLSGANAERCLTAGFPKEQKVLKLLLDAGAEMPCENECDAVSMKESLTVESQIESPKISERDIDENIDIIDANGRTLLHTAAYKGNLHLVQLLLLKGASIEALDKSKQTPLNLAAKQGYSDVVSALVEVGANVDNADEDGLTALRSAAWGGHTEVVVVLLSAGASVNSCDNDQRTALRAAAWGGHEEIVTKLLEHGADVNIADNEGRTALIAAAYMGHTEIVDHLLDYKANIDHADRDGRSALSVAALCIPASKGHESVVSLLLERGAEVNHQDKDGMTPLLVAAYEGHQEVCEMLLEWDADVDHCDKNGRTPLLAAASMGHEQIVTQLLFWGSAVDSIDSEGRTVLSIAAGQGNAVIVEQLLDRGLDEMHRDNAGMTPLHMAAYEGHKKVTDLLIEHLAKVNEIDNEGRIPLHLAAQEGHLPVLQVLVQHGSQVNQRSHDGKTPLRSAAIEGHRDVVEYLLNFRSDIDYQDADGRSTLYVLALENKYSIADLLLQKGAGMDMVDLEGRTALHVAAWQGHFEIVDVMCRRSVAIIDAVDNDNRTALQTAAWQGHDRVVQYLLDKGAFVDHTCNQGATALCIASQEGHDNVVRVLLQYHANPNHADQFGRTPMKVALKSGHLNVIKLLEEYGASVPTGNKSRSSSSASCTSSETKPSLQASETAILTVNSSVTISSGNPVVMNGIHMSNSPSESPDSTFDRRKSMLSNNSSKSSSYLTSSTNQSSLNSAMSCSQTGPTESDCMTFTQQLQQCSLSRNRSRPISRLLSPVSEPHSPVQSPLGSPALNSECLLFGGTNGHNGQTTPTRGRKANLLNKIQLATNINITMNPYNADISDDEVWKVNPHHTHSSLKTSMQLLENQRKKTPDHVSKPFMGQSALEMRSPETRRKRNGIVTNPNHKAKGINSVGHMKKLAQLESSQRGDNSASLSSDGSLSTNGRTSPMVAIGDQRAPVRPSGLPLKKETPL